MFDDMRSPLEKQADFVAFDFALESTDSIQDESQGEKDWDGSSTPAPAGLRIDLRRLNYPLNPFNQL